MKVSDLENIKDFKLVQSVFEDSVITNGYTSDLLSDVMANAGEANILITIQAHKNSLAVCKLLDIKALVICNGREPEDDFLQIAKKEKIAVFSTELNQFQSSILIGNLL
jgi:hypothetical protein